MRFRLWLAAAALIGAFALPTIAAAQSIAYTVPGGRTYMRAGPGVDFPIVAQVLGGSVVEVYGCLSDFSWCDSSVQGIRGWIASSRLEFDYAGGLVPFPNYYQLFRRADHRVQFRLLGRLLPRPPVLPGPSSPWLPRP